VRAFLRKPRSRGVDRRGQIKDMQSIHVRPPEIEDRLIPGHWEGDLIKGEGNRSSVGTLVERTTRFVVLAKMDSAEGGFRAPFGLVHFGVTFTVLVLGRWWRGDQRGIDDCSLAHHQTLFGQMRVDGVEDLAREPIRFQQMAELEQGRRVGR
jgi:hypothetical protein